MGVEQLQDFTKGNATKQIISFALPMLVGNIFQQAYSMSDAVIVGRFVGGNALAAVGSSMSMIHFLLSVLIGLTTGASVVISQFYGARQDGQLQKTVSTSILFLAGFALIISIIGVAGAPLFLSLLDVPEGIFSETTLYLRIAMGTMIFSVFYNMYTSYLRALGDSKSPLLILIISTLLNVLLDLLFVAVFNWGVGGAAVATAIAQALACILCMAYAGRKVPLLKINKLIFDKALFRLVLRYSLPAAIQLSTVSLASLTIIRLVNSFGESAVAGYTAAVKIDEFAIMPLSNISMAISTFVGQNIGAANVDRAKKGFRSSLVFMVLAGIVLSTIALVCGRSLITLFVDAADPNVTEIVGVGAKYLSIIVCFYTLFATFFAFNGFFRGAGDAVIVMALTITSLTIRSVSAHILVYQFGLGPEAVAWSIPIGWGLCSLLAWLYYHKNMWAGKAAVQVAGK